MDWVTLQLRGYVRTQLNGLSEESETGCSSLIGPSRTVIDSLLSVLYEELHDLYSSPSIIRIIKSRRMRWAGYVARIERRGTRIDYWWESQRERAH
jgi:hypothetical protein